MGTRGVSDALADVRAIASSQHGVVLAAQNRAAGLSRRSELRLVGQGWLTPIRPRAFSVGRAPSPWQEAVAVVLMAGAGAALSHTTAARIHGMSNLRSSDWPEVSTARNRNLEIVEAHVHRTTRLDESETVLHRGVRVTSPIRTLLDVAPRLGTDLLSRVVDEGMISGIWTPGQISAGLAGHRRRPGTGRLHDILGAYRDERTAQTDLEARAVRALSCFRPFEVQYQVDLGGMIAVLDIAWPPRKIAVETDGWLVRSRSRRKFDHERRRHNLLVARGWTVVQLTSAMSDDEMRYSVASVLISNVPA